MNLYGEMMYLERKNGDDPYIKVTKKLGDDTRKPQIIVNLRGIGYKFIPPKEEFICE